MRPLPNPPSPLSDANLDDRKTARTATCLPAVLSGPEMDTVPTRVLDLTHLGCRVSVREAVAADTLLSLALPTFTDVGARVVWCRDGEIGLDFEHPLPPRVVDYILRAVAPAVSRTAGEAGDQPTT